MSERERITRKGPGRRVADWHCPEHEYIQDSTKESRERVCGKIAKVEAEVGKMVQWKIFALLVSLAVVVIGSGFGFFGVQIGKTNDLIQLQTEKMGSINQTVGVVLWRLDGMEKKVDRIESQGNGHKAGSDK